VRIEEEPDSSPLAPAPVTLTEFLTLQAENRRLRARGTVGRLEDELDQLHRTLEAQRGREEERLRESKLKALAEFAAGAGHEINNPLAVISCQAQHLLHHEAEPERRTALEKIVAQTQRIHALLRDLMQFARPAAPVRRRVDLLRIVDEVATALGELAHKHQVRLLCREEGPTAPPPCLVDVDEKQVRTALSCLVKNAVEAAGADGWVRLRLEQDGGRVSVAVEDSGPGLTDAQREHLFDPFYSGRSAGRGPGLGLPTAWALARQQGGEVLLASQPGETTRFILRLPIPEEPRDALAG
jgi:signal transduction histidine kinase